MCNKICRNEFSNPTFHKLKKEREREEQNHNPTSKAFVKLLEMFSLVTLVTLVTSYNKLSLLPLVVRH